MKENKKLKCSVCYAQGVNKTLCEVIAPGLVSIKRMESKKGKDFTIVKGEKFEIICGRCGETIYFRE